MDEQKANSLRWRQALDRAERDMIGRMETTRTKFPCKFSGGNIRMLVREGGKCLDEFLDGPWVHLDHRGDDGAAGGLLGFAKAIENNVLAYVAANTRSDPQDRVWLASCEATAIFRERAELAITDAAATGRPGAESPAPSQAQSRGRRAGIGGYAKADAPLIVEMEELLVSNDATSPWDAARIVANKAKGSEANRQRRLTDAFYAKHPDHRGG